MSERNSQIAPLHPALLLFLSLFGLAAGVFTQTIRSSWGLHTLALPYTICALLLLIAALLLIFGFRLRRALTGKTSRRIEPLAAVRLLAAARAGQCLGAILSGFAAGLFLAVFAHLSFLTFERWIPNLLTFFAAIFLLICAIIVENFCKLPPEDPENHGDTFEESSSGQTKECLGNTRALLKRREK